MVHALLFAAAFTGATVSGVAGIAGGVILLVVLSQLYPLEIAIPVHGMAQLVSNLSRATFLRHSIDWGRGKPVMLGAPLGATLGYLTLNSWDPGRWPFLAIALIAFYTAVRPASWQRVPVQREGLFLVGVGLGFLTCFVGATGPLLILFVRGRETPKEAVVATLAACHIVFHSAKIPVFWSLHFPYWEYLDETLVLILGGILGSRVGVTILKRIDQRQFTLVVRCALMAIVLRLIWQFAS